LIKNGGGLFPRKLKGVEIPMTLPQSLLRDCTGGFPAPAVQGQGVISPSRKLGISLATDWTIPQNNKLKFTQVFNQHDKQRTGFLTGSQARPLLLNSGLSQVGFKMSKLYFDLDFDLILDSILQQAILAQIWGLADFDNDGKLSVDEFCVAMHLVDKAKTGEVLPPTLPKELLPPSYRRKASLTSASSATNDPLPLGSNAGDLRAMGISQVRLRV
jgi:hypothetical protein